MSRELKQSKKHDLNSIIEHHGIKRFGEAHNAASDAHACAAYFLLARKIMTPIATPFGMGIDLGYTTEFPPALFALPAVVRSGGKIEFCYKDDKGGESVRAITPYSWHTKDAALYFTGLCHLRNERRTFRADRVQQVMSMSEAA